MADPVDPTEPAPWDLIRIAMVIGPVTGYFHQYYTMHKMKTSMGFSSVTCGVLLVSSIIRIFFWIGEPVHGSGWYKEHTNYWGTHFWNWTTIGPYYSFLAAFTLVVGLSLLIIGNTSFYVALLGLAALGIEATVPLPQAIENHRSKSTAGFSPAILLMWVIGDSFKTYYYISTHAKYQFVGCGIIQLCIDCVIITQTVIYSKFWRESRRRKQSGEGMAGGGLSSFSGYGHGHSSSLQDHLVGGATVSQGRSSSEALLAVDDEDMDEDEVRPRY
ncbi:PQ-loop repeat-containing protein 1 [Mortierella sp. GBA30]|nr:PQ-loop repeat-containing protein 1 [Mortierella sp. GBA30]